MKETFRRAALELLAPVNYTFAKLTRKDSIKILIRDLRPYMTDKALIRLGPDKDGGYLIPNDMEGIEACFSPGIGNKFGFEIDCSRAGMKVFLADKTADLDTIHKYHFHFTEKFIGPVTNQDFITMDEWVKESLPGSNADLMLQMDIEGFEYLSIINMSDTLLNRFRILVIECHGFHKLWNNEFFTIVNYAFKKLLKTHTLVHIHPNNCCGVNKFRGIEVPNLAELTFYRNDRIHSKKPQTVFPHPLDADNVNKPPLHLPAHWYMP